MLILRFRMSSQASVRMGQQPMPSPSPATHELVRPDIVSAAQKEIHIAEGSVGKPGQSLGTYLENGLALKFGCRNAVFGQQIILRLVFPQLKHRGVLKIWCL